MASKIVYNNTSYDILDAIVLLDRDYLVLVNPDNINNITFVESVLIDNQRKYFLPPKSFDISNNVNCDLKRLQTNFVASTIVDVLKKYISNENLNNLDEIKIKFNEIKDFIYTDLTIKSILEDKKNLNINNFSKILDYIEKYLSEQFIVVVKNDIEQEYNYLDRPVVTRNGLDYEWLYELNLNELKELASSKNRTSTELIYIMDALEKRKENDQAINKYNEIGHVKSLRKRDNTAAFIDTLLLSLITASFLLLLLISIF